MVRRLLTSILVAIAALSGAARAGAEEERLRVAVPEDWTTVPSVEQGEVRLEQFLPPGQSVNDWVEMIMVVTHLGAGGMDPAAAAGATPPRFCTAWSATHKTGRASGRL